MTVLTAQDQLLAASDSLAGPAALLIVLILLIATVFLIRNMDKRIKRLPREFPVKGAPRTDDGKSGTTVHEQLPPTA